MGLDSTTACSSATLDFRSYDDKHQQGSYPVTTCATAYGKSAATATAAAAATRPLVQEAGDGAVAGAGRQHGCPYRTFARRHSSACCRAWASGTGGDPRRSADTSPSSEYMRALAKPQGLRARAQEGAHRRSRTRNLWAGRGPGHDRDPNTVLQAELHAEALGEKGEDVRWRILRYN